MTVDLTNSEEDSAEDRQSNNDKDEPENGLNNSSISSHQMALEYINQYSASAMQAAVIAFQNQVASQPQVFAVREALPEVEHPDVAVLRSNVSHH